MIHKFKLLFGLVFCAAFCIPGTQRDACRYNAESKKIICEFSQLMVLIATQRMASVGNETLTGNALINCQIYYEEIEKCKKEENRFLPSIYG
ncbi:hypothetical protein [Leptospira bouyouniensis]|uniref:hypothetical protein n=1 Tax=Leptospira bouyouniensis TaxID=2484911 RepID=UPI001090CEFC|nr:hypothetical protein [Leptospira bouyouniensis]TGM74980.1 hypothetical protein EHQ99_17465 [Leptospira bouyouniensis]